MTTPRLLSERYELGEVLGYGGMAEVHRGLDTRLGRDVAVKVLRADLARDPQFQMRFRREAQNAAALNHPAIVAVYDTGEVESEFGPLPYIVMEYVDGQTLRELLASGRKLLPERASTFSPLACSGERYWAVPITAAVAVMVADASAMARAMPKSITFTAPVLLIMMLAGLTSRWMMPC